MVLLCWLAPAAAPAQTFTWTHIVGGNASGSWTSADNWAGGVVPTTVNANVLFNTLSLTADATITLNGSAVAGALTFGNLNSAYTQSWIINPGSPSSSTLTLGGSNPVITVTNLGSGSSRVIANGVVIVNAPISGTNGLTICSEQYNYLQLKAANTYSGGTIISSALGSCSVSVANPGAFGTGPVLVGASPGDGQVYFQCEGDQTLTNSFVINTARWILDSTYVNDGSGIGAGNLTINGPVQLNQGASGPADIYCEMNLTLNGNLTVLGGNPLTFDGLGKVLTLNGSNYVSTASTFSSGTLVLNGSMNGGAIWTVGSGATLTGTGTVRGGYVSVKSGGTFVVGSNGVGATTVSSYQSVAGANLVMSLGTTTGATNGYLTVNGNLLLAGQILVNNPGLPAGDYTNIYYSGSFHNLGLNTNLTMMGSSSTIDTSTPHYIVFHVRNGVQFPAGAQTVPMDSAAPLTLSWPQGLTVVAYDLYLGTSSTAVAGASTTTTGIYLGRTNGVTFNVSSLQPNTTYYWRVDSVASDGTITAGAVYSFTTGAAMVDLMSDTWVATDALGRSLPLYSDCGNPRTNRYVGLFYYLMRSTNSYTTSVWDIDAYLAANPWQNPAYPWTNKPSFPDVGLWWWGQPEAGYYCDQDPWVLRRTLSMLSEAGVDVLLLGADSSDTELGMVKSVCDVIEQLRCQGMATHLKVAFFTTTVSGAASTWLYNEFYAPGLYPDLWFYWQGKPLILGSQGGSGDSVPSAAVQNFFTWRYSWADDAATTNGGAMANDWDWIQSSTPQNWGYTGTRADLPEALAVSCSGGWACNGGWYSGGGIGRSYTNHVEPAYNNQDEPVAGTQGQGLFFAEQFNYGLKYDPQFMFINGWNEWQANTQECPSTGAVQFLGRSCPAGGFYFLDEYNEEYSRDIEPMSGGHTDNYYFQMAAQVRRYKGVRSVPSAGAAQTINVSGSFSQWTNVTPAYYDVANDTLWRNYPSSVTAVGTYTNNNGRNDFTVMKVARDAANFYFMAQCRSNITSYTGSNWMVLFLNTDTNHSTGWEGYDYALNLGGVTATTTTLSRNISTSNSWDWTVVSGSLAYQVAGNQLMLSIPRASLGLTNTNSPVTFYFHWADNWQTNAISDFGLDGDSAPDRRFDYCYQTQGYLTNVLLQDGFENGKQTNIWGKSWTNGSMWSVTSNQPFNGGYCAFASRANGTTSNALTATLNTTNYSSIRISFQYKLQNVISNSLVLVTYEGTNKTAANVITNLGADICYPTGQAWGYNERTNVWLRYAHVLYNSGSNAQFFTTNFTLSIVSPLTTSSQTLWVDDVLISGITPNCPEPVVLAGSRAYDGTSQAAASVLTLVNNADGTNLTLSGVAALAGQNVGSQAITSFAGLSLNGAAANSYTLAGASGSVTINPAVSSFSGLATNQTIIYGTSALVLGGQISAAGPVYPAQGEAVTVTINGNAQTAAINDSLGDISLIYPAATLTVKDPAYTITYSYAGDALFNSTIDTNTTLTVKPLPVVLAGTRPYDGTSEAAASILSVANAINGDEVNLNSGVCALAGSGVGSERVASPGSLVLGGSAAGNYTLAGASGSVTITNPLNPFAITASSLRVTETNFVVCWQSVPGGIYRVLTNSALSPRQSWGVAGGLIVATNTTTCFTLPVATGMNSLFVLIKDDN